MVEWPSSAHPFNWPSIDYQFAPKLASLPILSELTDTQSFWPKQSRLVLKMQSSITAIACKRHVQSAIWPRAKTFQEFEVCSDSPPQPWPPIPNMNVEKWGLDDLYLMKKLFQPTDLSCVFFWADYRIIQGDVWSVEWIKRANISPLPDCSEEM